MFWLFVLCVCLFLCLQYFSINENLQIRDGFIESENKYVENVLKSMQKKIKRYKDSKHIDSDNV